MKDMFCISPHNTYKRHDIFVQSRKTTKYGDKSLGAIGRRLWNSLLDNCYYILG